MKKIKTKTDIIIRLLKVRNKNVLFDLKVQMYMYNLVGFYLTHIAWHLLDTVFRYYIFYTSHQKQLPQRPSERHVKKIVQFIK